MSDCESSDSDSSPSEASARRPQPPTNVYRQRNPDEGENDSSATGTRESHSGASSKPPQGPARPAEQAGSVVDHPGFPTVEAVDRPGRVADHSVPKESRSVPDACSVVAVTAASTETGPSGSNFSPIRNPLAKGGTTMPKDRVSSGKVGAAQLDYLQAWQVSYTKLMSIFSSGYSFPVVRRRIPLNPKAPVQATSILLAWEIRTLPTGAGLIISGSSAKNRSNRRRVAVVVPKAIARVVVVDTSAPATLLPCGDTACVGTSSENPQGAAIKRRFLRQWSKISSYRR
ncbi:unnamed protein product [Notodromas monacha]|uniref:Uncharacterized protein n=1 Tax=Notodromas monacha TaxID=399045 RepID=A0A7R9G8X3_9CRUS|nr:unnamed protein product [Notodromas monacha]CAG0912229.1 unnamed protein product [Notodromas monacha]